MFQFSRDVLGFQRVIIKLTKPRNESGFFERSLNPPHLRYKYDWFEAAVGDHR